MLVFTLDSYGTRLDDAARLAVYDELRARLGTLPGVTRVAASRSVPVHTSGNARLLDLPGSPETTMDRAAFTNMITPGYFDTFGIRLLRGRDFSDYDTKNEYPSRHHQYGDGAFVLRRSRSDGADLRIPRASPTSGLRWSASRKTRIR